MQKPRHHPGKRFEQIVQVDPELPQGIDVVPLDRSVSTPATLPAVISRIQSGSTTPPPSPLQTRERSGLLPFRHA